MSQRLPAVTPREVIRALERYGFHLQRITGSHHVLKHPTDPRIRVVIAMHRKEFHPSTLRRIVRDAGLSEDEFLDLL